MEDHLLQKEEELRKLNEKLQIRNKQLMEEFDTVLKKQDALLKETSSKPNFDYLNLSCRKNPFQINENEDPCNGKHVAARVKLFDSAMKERNVNISTVDDTCTLRDVPESVDHMGIKGMAHFYRAKIKAMQNEYDKLQMEFKNKSEETRKLQKELLKVTDDKEKWFQSYTTNKALMSKLELQVSATTSKCASKENEIGVLRKELEQVKKDLKSTNSNVSGSEVRLNRALEENEKMKVTIKVAKQEEKDLKETHRKEITEVTESLKRLEKQRAELVTAFKKQMYLIDNLKKQKVCMEAAKLTQLSENEFMKIIDWKLD